MTSSSQIRANRANAKRSTGPRTIEGKSRASRNAVRHGLFSAALWAGQDNDRVTLIANKLCEGDPFPYRYEAALEVADAQVLLDRIRLARAYMINTTKAPPKKKFSLGLGMTMVEFEELKLAVQHGKLRRIKQLVQAPAKRFKAFVEAALRGEIVVPPAEPVRPPVPVSPDEQRLMNFRAALPDLPTLDQHEQRAYNRRQRAIRRFDALADDG
jgi:hypothetical protein